MSAAFSGVSPWLTFGLLLAGTALGALLRHAWSAQALRACERRTAALCGWLDSKDARLQAQRAELQASESRVRDLEAELANLRSLAAEHGLHTDPTLQAEDNEDAGFVSRRVLAMRGRQPIEPAVPSGMAARSGSVHMIGRQK